MPEKFKINLQVHESELPLLLPMVKESGGRIDISCPGGICIEIGEYPPFPAADWEEGLFSLFVGWLGNLINLDANRREDFYFVNGRLLMTVALESDSDIVRCSLCDYDFEDYAVQDARVLYSEFRSEIVRCAQEVRDAVLAVEPDIDTARMRLMREQLNKLI